MKVGNEEFLFNECNVSVLQETFNDYKVSVLQDNKHSGDGW